MPDTQADSGQNLAMAYFYCQQQDGRRSPEDVLCSFLKQWVLQNDAAFMILRDRYEEEERKGFMSSQLSLEDSRDILKKMATEMSKTKTLGLLILDALDECGRNTDDRHQLLSMFQSMLLESDVPVKIIISGRHDQDIDRWKEHELKYKTASINIQATDNKDDICEFVMNRIIKFKRVYGSDALSGDMESTVIQTFQEKSNGMYVICTAPSTYQTNSLISAMQVSLG